MSGKIHAERINASLKGYKECIRLNKSRRELGDAEYLFEKSLYEAPIDFKSIVIHLQLFDKRVRIRDELKEKMGVIVEDGKCTIQVAIPRKPDLSPYGSHGSAVREKLFSTGTIETLRLDRMYDPLSDASSIVSIYPTRIGLFNLSRRLGEYAVSPLEIERIELSKDLPGYLTKEEKEFIANWPDN